MSSYQKKGLSIFLRLLMAFIGITLVIGCLLMVSLYFFSRQSLEKQTKEGIVQQLTIISDSFAKEYGDNLLRTLKSLITSPLLDEYLLASKNEQLIIARKLERLFLQTVADFPGYQGIYCIDHLGLLKIGVVGQSRIRTYRKLKPEAIASEAVELKGACLVTACQLFAQLESSSLGKVHLLGPFKDNGQTSFLAGISKMDPDTGKLGGVIMISHSLARFFADLAKIKFLGENFIWVFAPDGNVLRKPPNKSKIFNPQKYLTKSFQDKPQSVTRKEGFLVYQDFGITKGQPLVRVAIAIPSTLLLENIKPVIRFFSLIFAISIIVALILAFLTAHYISAPIIALTSAATNMAKGNLSARIGRQTTGEIQLLIDSFNQMANDLKKTMVSKDYVDNIIRSMINTLMVVSLEGKIIQSNAATQTLLGYRENELIGQPIELILEEDLSSDKASGLNDILANGFINQIEKTYRARDGQRIPVFFSASVMKDNDDKVQGLVCVAQDISERKIAQEALARKTLELERVNSELNQFAYVVSHDLKAPLRAIANLSQWIEEDIGQTLTGDTRNQLDLMRGRVHRMEALINAILEYSRIGRVAVEQEMVDLKALLAEIIDSLAVPPGFTIKVASDMPTMFAPRIRLHQVFANLISNAIKYSDRKDGLVEIAVNNGGQFYEFGVADNGPGIAPQFHEKIFVIFQTLASRDQIESTGIGLTLVKKIVEEQGGSITIESGVGQGATFRFTWPKQM